MRRVFTGVTTVAVAAGVAVMAGAAPASASTPAPQTVQVTGDSTGLHFSRTHVAEGNITFNISTTNAENGTGVTLFRFKKGATFATLDQGLLEEFGQVPNVNPGQGTIDLLRDVTIYGVADVQAGTPVSATVNLNEGVYYSFDSSGTTLPTAQNVTRLVVGEGSDRAPSQLPGWLHSASVDMTTSDRFQVRGELHAKGSILFSNVSDTLHFADITPVAPGTTDAQVQAFFDSGSQAQPPWALNGPSISTDVLSPGKQVVLHYNLPKGTYVLLCFVADDKTGMPHALMGMHKVIHLGS